MERGLPLMLESCLLSGAGSSIRPFLSMLFPSSSFSCPYLLLVRLGVGVRQERPGRASPGAPSLSRLRNLSADPPERN